MTDISDAKQRTDALDPSRSFIVQAPAGSGKTELLAQRYLKLLAIVNYPEEIVAITFTRKAAAEMRNRVLMALDSAQYNEPDEPHKKLTWKLAHAALDQDQQQQWQLTKNPNRLRIQTFDSLNTSLTKQMPTMAELGASPQIKEQADTLYHKAANATLQSLADPDLGPHLAYLLRHLDNRLGNIEKLIAAMLARRDQWLPHIFNASDTSALEDALQQEIESHLEKTNQQFPAAQMTQLIRLAGFAADNLIQAKNPKHANSPILAWQEHQFRPSNEWQALKLWRGLSELLLTKTGSIRKSFTVAIGFPAPSEKGIDNETKQQRLNAKAELAELIADISQQTSLCNNLASINILPLVGYNKQQAKLLLSLTHVLLMAAAQLALAFQETGEVDFAELQLRALQALGNEQAPTDLALSLDYKLKHLLVDEFQDTSSSQHQLLRQLTTEWRHNDEHSLFLVGDPMQSIYRFREAEVGLFLKTREQGLGDLQLDSLTLSMNFRSQAGIVDWVNQSLSQLFPEQAGVADSAVSYTASTPYQDQSLSTAVVVHASAEVDNKKEADDVLTVVQDCLTKYPRNSIAILARGRNHLAGIAKSLNEADISYQAINVDPLLTRTLVQDLYSLTRALLNPEDRLAWLSILRAPWLGISIEDLLILTENKQRNIYRSLTDTTLVDSLSKDAQQRIQRLTKVLSKELPYRGNKPLRQWIETIWLSIGGLAIAGENAEKDAEAYFQLIENQQGKTTSIDLTVFEKALDKLYAPPNAQATSQIQLMTMHASKGLEFDCVILPGLGKGTRSNDSELLYWQQRPNKAAEMHLLMAPTKSSREDKEPISAFIQQLNKNKDQLEVVRLIYVAATRAKQQLHLFGHISFDDKGNKKPPIKGSLLQHLWPIVADHYEFLEEPIKKIDPHENSHHQEKRLSPDWTLDYQPQDNLKEPETLKKAEIDFDWAGDTARHVGTLVHRYLERIATEGLAHWKTVSLDKLKPALHIGLANLGVDQDDMEAAIEKATRAIKQSLEDEQGQWLLSEHEEAQCEMPLTLHQEHSQHYVIDRTFIDEEGRRWIVDYKTGDHQDDDIDDFLNHEQERYRAQLENYGHLFSLMEDRPIKLMLYFPMLKEARVWDFVKTKDSSLQEYLGK